MCTNAAKTAANLMAAIEPTIKSLLTLTNLITTPAGIAVIAAYDAALVALQGWKSGTVADEILELLGDFQTAFSALPLPANVITLTNIILGGIEAVIAVITANSPAPASADSTVDAEDVQVTHQVVTATEAMAKIHALIPGIKLDRHSNVVTQYDNAWNSAVSDGGFPADMLVA